MPTTIEYFSKAVIPNNINFTIFRHSHIPDFRDERKYRHYLSMKHMYTVSSFLALPKIT